MSYADELRNKSASYNPEQMRLEAIEKHINECIKVCLDAIKNRCDLRAGSGKNGISGYLDVSRDTEYGYPYILSGFFCEDKPGASWRKHAEKAPNFDFGMGEKAKSGREQKAIAEEIKEGIYNELSRWGFNEVSIDTIKVRKNNGSSWPGSSTIFNSHVIYAIYITVTW